MAAAISDRFMPKSAKKRKEKAADFTKAKLKLGKSKQQPSNVVDTSFKAKSIALPTQSISILKEKDEPTTRRRLTFDDLLAQLKHYNFNTRKDALSGLRELLEANLYLLGFKLTALLNACARLISDNDASVRRSLLTFLDWVLPLVPSADLLPHAQTLLLYTTSAQTHIFPEIRLDATRVLDILLYHIPSAVVEGWATNSDAHGSRVLRGYLGILSAGSPGEQLIATPTIAISLSPLSRSIVLKSLASFLERCLMQYSTQPPLDMAPAAALSYMKYFFSTPDAFVAFSQVLQPRLENQNSIFWSQGVNLGQFSVPESIPLYSPSSQWDPTHLVDIDDDIDDEQSPAFDHRFILELSRSLQLTITSSILEYAPAIFTASSNIPENEAEILFSALRITRSLYIPLLQHRSDLATHLGHGDIETILSYLTPYFPFHLSSHHDKDSYSPNPETHAAHAVVKFAPALQQANVTFCELASLLPLSILGNHKGKSTDMDPLPRLRHQRKWSQSKIVAVPALVEYVSYLLHGQAVPPTGIGKPLSASLYHALLPTIWALACTTEGATKETVLKALLEHGIRTPATSPVKGLSINFIGHLILLGADPRYLGKFNFPSGDKCLMEWLCHLPKCLWELGNSSPTTTEVILRLLLRLYHQRPQSICNETLDILHSRFAPFFTVEHPARGRLDGPFHKLAMPLQRLALDLAHSLITVTKSDQGLRASVTVAVAGKGAQPYWEHIHNL